MKNFNNALLLLCLVLPSCQNKTKQLLVKKWDCVKIDNLAPVSANLFSKADSVAAEKVEDALQNLVWTFNNDNTYQCSTGNTTTVQGTYTIGENDKVLILITSLKNANYYNIVTLGEQELILKAQSTGVPIIMYFRVH